MSTTPAHGFMSVSVHYVDNARNVKTNRGGITGYIQPIPLPSMQNYYTHKYFYTFMQFNKFYIICVFYCTYCNCIFFLNLNFTT